MTWSITTPIYYVNGKPHIGHAYTTIAADAAARWMRRLGHDTFLLTGTDEHGQKVAEAAAARGMAPKVHCDDMVVGWRALMDRLGITYDRFLRTTDADHIAVVQGVLTWMKERDLIYRAEYTGWYSIAAERFWTEKDLVDGKCPDTGTAVVEITEANWFFRMSQFREPLLAHLAAHPEAIQPESRLNEVLGFLRQPLEDLCISRPKARMNWGIDLPFDPDFVTYVWFDALLNYATGAGWSPGKALSATRWPATVHLVGKDILTTHAVYWNTMLLALGLPLPTTLFAHGWWVSTDGRKMSKSLGNTIDVDGLIEGFGVDVLRWFLLRDVAFGADGAFSYDNFLVRTNADLANDLGNLAHRATSMTVSWRGGAVPPLAAPGPAEAALAELAHATVASVADAMPRLAFHEALEAIVGLVRAGNKYVDTRAPWALRKSGDEAGVDTVLRTLLELCHLVAALAAPVAPGKMAELGARLGRDAATLDTFARDVVHGQVAALGGLTTGAPIHHGDPLFPRFDELPAALAPAPAKETPMAPEAPPTPAVPTITYDDFAKIQLRVGRIVEAAPHPDADRLLCLKVDIGEAAPRSIVAGIRARFAPEALLGRQIVVVANLAPRKLRGVESHGMLLAASDGDLLVDLVSVDAPPGSVVR